MPIRLVDKESVGETPTGATETVALPGTLELSANRIGMEGSIPAFRRSLGEGGFPRSIDRHGLAAWRGGMLGESK